MGHKVGEKSRLFPSSSVSEPPLQERIGHSWGSAPTNLRDMKFFRSWLVYDSEIQTGVARGVNWSVVAGLVLAFGVSAGFWTGVGLMIVHFWK
ncbi:MAG: hypothetical protein WB799_17340 [Candidatus Sulfotelmatobacter sp.]